MVLLPNNDIVMTYAVRKGYPDTPDGFHNWTNCEILSSYEYEFKVLSTLTYIMRTSIHIFLYNDALAGIIRKS